MKYFFAVLVIAIGAAAVAYGESDDSPGLQLIGGVLVITAIVVGIRTTRHGNR